MDMPRPRLPHLTREKSRHGRWKWYFRQGKGSRIRLPDEYGSKEFMEAYHAAIQGKVLEPETTSARKDTLGWLFELYKGSDAFSKLQPNTRRVRNNLLNSIAKSSGESHVKSITRKVIRDGMARRASKPESANAFLKAMRAVFKWALKADFVESDPTREVEYIQTKSDGWSPWTDDEIEKFQAFYPLGTKERLAFDILLFTGLRRSDAVRLGYQHIRNGVISIKTKKTGEEVFISIGPELQESIDAGPTGDMIFIVTQHREPYSSDGFGNWFRRKVRAAGITGKSPHGVRKAAAAHLADERATTQELMSVFGWTNLKHAEKYTKSAQRKRLATEASKKLSRERQENETPRTSNLSAGKNPKDT